MSNLFAKVGGVIASIGLAIGGFFGYVPEPEIAYVPEAVYVPQEEVYAPEEETLGADAVLPVAGVTYYLAGTGISSSATSFTLTSFTVTQNGKKIQDSEMSETFYFTLEPGSRSRQEIVACTTVVQNADNTATISGCTRGMAPVTPYTASTSLQFAHAGGSIAILSNPPQLYNQVAIKDNDETITGYWDFPTPVGGNNPTTKDYVLSVVTGGSISTTNTIVSGVAGETVATGTIVYLDRTLSRWYKADNDLQSTYVDQVLGIAQGPGTAGASISNGILTYGLDSTQKGMTGGDYIFLSGTAGATTTATTSQVLGKAISATTMFFDQNLIDSSVYTQKTFSATTTFNSINNFIGTTTGVGSVTYISTTTVWNVPTNAKLIKIQLWGAGGSGSRHGTYGGSGGGGGEYNELFMPVSKLASSTILVTIGIGGTAITGASDGISGGSSSFGNFLTVGGGGGGSIASTNVVGGGGGGSGITGGMGSSNNGGGYLSGTNYFGSTAGGLTTAYYLGVGSGNNAGIGPFSISETFGHIGGGGGGYITGSEQTHGVDSVYGGGGGSGGGADASNSCTQSYGGGSSRYGGGGGGGACTGGYTDGGTSFWGGNGGAGSVAGTATSGSFPGGGGGGTTSGTSGAGGNGLAIITVF